MTKREMKILMLIGVAVIILTMAFFLCGSKEAPKIEAEEIEFETGTYVLKYGDSLWTLYEEYGNGISWERWQSEMHRYNDSIGSFMREGEEIQIVRAK